MRRCVGLGAMNEVQEQRFGSSFQRNQERRLELYVFETERTAAAATATAARRRV